MVIHTHLGLKNNRIVFFFEGRELRAKNWRERILGAFF